MRCLSCFDHLLHSRQALRIRQCWVSFFGRNLICLLLLHHLSDLICV
ncbi:hypothetical protein IC582_024562 [Cucumis melo]